jgi:hypothetical protein
MQPSYMVIFDTIALAMASEKTMLACFRGVLQFKMRYEVAAARWNRIPSNMLETLVFSRRGQHGLFIPPAKPSQGTGAKT